MELSNSSVALLFVLLQCFAAFSFTQFTLATEHHGAGFTIGFINFLDSVFMQFHRKCCSDRNLTPLYWIMLMFSTLVVLHCCICAAFFICFSSLFLFLSYFRQGI